MTRFGNGMLTAVAAALCIFLILPTLAVAPISFTETDFITFPPHGFSTRWYEEFFSRPEWRGSLATSAIVAVLTTLLATTLGTMIALALG
ncbi:ABC transporter permease, partial [Rhizobiaceae sp. 2RAB30]